jgi:hypothetical protein
LLERSAERDLRTSAIFSRRGLSRPWGESRPPKDGLSYVWRDGQGLLSPRKWTYRVANKTSVSGRKCQPIASGWNDLVPQNSNALDLQLNHVAISEETSSFQAGAAAICPRTKNFSWVKGFVA